MCAWKTLLACFDSSLNTVYSLENIVVEVVAIVVTIVVVVVVAVESYIRDHIQRRQFDVVCRGNSCCKKEKIAE